MRADQICGNLKQKVQDRPTEGGLNLALELRPERNNQVKKPLPSSPARMLYVKHAPVLEIKEEKWPLLHPEEFTSLTNDGAKYIHINQFCIP